MTHTIFWRLVWKEYRLQRALWIAMAALTGMLMLLVHALVIGDGERVGAVFAIATMLPAFYCLGCGAILFAGEREAEVFEFHRSLPVGAGRVFAAKIVFGLTSSIVLFGAMWLAAYGLCGEHLAGRTQVGSPHVLFLAGVGTFGMGLFLWAVFFSLLSHSVILAALLGGVGASVHFELLSNLFNILEGNLGTLPWAVALTVAVIAADVWLGVRWFREKRERRSTFAPFAGNGASPTLPTALSIRFRRPSRLTILGRLLWQHWRQSRGLWLVLGAASIALAAWIAVRWFAAGYGDDLRDPLTQFFAIVPAFAVVPLLGLCAFHADQWAKGYRFLVDRGVPPKYVWSSRLLSVLLVAIALSPFLLIAPYYHFSRILYDMYDSTWNYGSDSIRRFFWQLELGIVACGYAAGYVAIAVASGQFVSMLLRSSILAGVGSILLTGLLTAWALLMIVWNVSWWWSVLPIPLVLLLVSRLRVRDWLLERNRLGAWLAPGLALAVPAIAIVTAALMHRVYEIPLVQPNITIADWTRPMSAEEEASYDRYVRASRQLSSLRTRPSSGDSMPAAMEERDDKRDVEAIRAEAVRLAMEASRGPFYLPVGASSRSDDWLRLSQFLLSTADQNAKDGKLDAALEQYLGVLRMSVQIRPYNFDTLGDYTSDAANTDWMECSVYEHLRSWAALPNQTAERLLDAARQVRQITADISAVGSLRPAYVRVRRFIEGDVNALQDNAQGGATAMETQRFLLGASLWFRLPWERARALRNLDLNAHIQLKLLEGTDQVTRGEVGPFGKYRFVLGRGVQFANPWLRLRYHEGDLLDVLRGPMGGYPEVYARMLCRHAAMVAQRRATPLILAISAWKLRNGSLPEDLGQLVGPYFDRVPIDPFSGRPFVYAREGVSSPIHWSQSERFVEFGGGDVPAKTPFVWSRGLKVRLAGLPPSTVEKATGKFTEQFEIVDTQNQTVRRPTSEQDVWSSGWPFPIP
jgi:hypothetical protein